MRRQIQVQGLLGLIVALPALLACSATTRVAPRWVPIGLTPNTGWSQWAVGAWVKQSRSASNRKFEGTWRLVDRRVSSGGIVEAVLEEDAPAVGGSLPYGIGISVFAAAGDEVPRWKQRAKREVVEIEGTAVDCLAWTGTTAGESAHAGPGTPEGEGLLLIAPDKRLPNDVVLWEFETHGTKRATFRCTRLPVKEYLGGKEIWVSRYEYSYESRTGLRIDATFGLSPDVPGFEVYSIYRFRSGAKEENVQVRTLDFAAWPAGPRDQ